MSNEKGVSLVETLLIIFAIGFIVLLLANLPNSMTLITKSRHLSLAREIAIKQIEDKRNISYDNLVDGDPNNPTAIDDSRLGLLPNGSGTVLVEPCDQTICANNEQIKAVSVKVIWTEINKQQSINLKTFIGKGGLNQ